MSWQMQAIGLYTRATRKRRFADPLGGERLLSEPKGSPEPPAKVVDGLLVSMHDIAGFPAYAVTREDTAYYDVPTVVYAHGGAFVSEIVGPHWQLIAQLAREVDAAVLVPIYGLAPQHTAREANEMMATIVDRSNGEGRPTYLVGDSAGGNLVLVAAQQAAARGATCIRGVTAMAPWLDLTMSNPEVEALEPHDPWLARAALHEVARVWADGTPLDDPTISPLFGPADGLPPVDLWIGDRDICAPDARLLRDALRAAGNDLTYHEQPGALHVYPLLPTPEGRRARAEMIDHIGYALA
ncbi:alpha/beta hydrolase [Nocardioides sp. GY 10113]|uniref:alpha/beta hydrolase fold domain-containing protein n=1 Tax=Nocardioides sp. GY 10113 TaxID=2569761 RepID=UPI0010A8DEC4|nr:alpha/beta hydrolase fold domain-containing protein [Nocardioides sp. GY 10113]TIC85907.1 alpha/beta hydrolase [Nocardioides sp. GY 10113]